MGIEPIGHISPTLDFPSSPVLPGTSAVLVDENLNVASLRFYNQQANPADYAVRASEAPPPYGTHAAFYERLQGLLNPNRDPWKSFSDVVSRDIPTFFFIGRRYKPSLLPENKGKKVFQFNYRWEALKNIPPDCFCIDEIVQIADGLYRGQLIYATDCSNPGIPTRPSPITNTSCPVTSS